VVQSLLSRVCAADFEAGGKARLCDEAGAILEAALQVRGRRSRSRMMMMMMRRMRRMRRRMRRRRRTIAVVMLVINVAMRACAGLPPRVLHESRVCRGAQRGTLGMAMVMMVMMMMMMMIMMMMMVMMMMMLTVMIG
jgi:hypothetical protein